MPSPFPWWPENKLKIKPLPNALSYIRINIIVENCKKAQGIDNEYLLNCAKLLREYIENQSDSGGNTAISDSNIWGLLDKGDLQKLGQCVEQSFLLEMSLRLLGFKETDAEFRYITATDQLPVPEFDGNTIPVLKKRICPNSHGNEWLFFDFPSNDPNDNLGGINDGEGTCRVLGKYLPGLMPIISDSPLELIKSMEGRGVIQRWYYFNNEFKKDEIQNSPTLPKQ